MEITSLYLHNQQFCIGCGVCAAACPHGALIMQWDDCRRWRPKRNEKKCDKCGICVRTCPFSLENHDNWIAEFKKHGEKTGVDDSYDCGVGWTMKRDHLFQSPSGGLTVEILKQLVTEKVIDGVITPVRVSAKIGAPHNEVRILKSPEELENARGSFYEPVCFASALEKAIKENGRYAIVATPCVLKALSLTPKIMQSRIAFRFGLICSHNVTGQFMDCLATREGVANGKEYKGNLRSKDVLMANASRYFNTFHEKEGRVFHRDRYSTGFTRMWRSFYFAQECCLYCPDFFSANADISVKDVWGRLKKSPFGRTMAVVRNKQISNIIRKLADDGVIGWQNIAASDVLNDQLNTAIFKQGKSFDRLRQRQAWRIIFQRPGACFEHLKKLVILRWSSAIYRKIGIPPFFSSKKYSESSDVEEESSVQHKRRSIRPKILIAGGYGYGNVGDEAQLNACIKHWQTLVPEAAITVLSPNPEYTIKTHGITAIEATRNIWFGADVSSHYAKSDMTFRCWFFWIAARECLRALRRNIFSRIFARLENTWGGGKFIKYKDVLSLSARSSSCNLHDIIKQSDVLHFCGGGYLTGMTLSRLWDSMLLAKIAQYYGVRVVLSGQTIGRFNDALSRWIARWGLKKCDWIYLRDAFQSKKDLHEIGIDGDNIHIAFDDALFCETACNDELNLALGNSGLNLETKYIAVNFHHWGQADNMRGRITERFAAICSKFSNLVSMPILLVPMLPSDKKAINNLADLLDVPAVCLNYEYDFRLAKAAIGAAEYCLTFKHHPIIFAMASGIPTLAVALDQYYEHKNRGALDLFGQGHFVINEGMFWNERKTTELINELIENRSQNRKTIISALKKLKEKDGEMIWLTAVDIMTNEKLKKSAFNREWILSKAVKNIIADKWKRWKDEKGIEKVALFGAGLHTQWLLSQPWIKNGPAVLKILDASPTSGTILGYPVVAASENNACSSVDAIVISSDQNESLLYTQALAIFDDIPILTFYENRYGTFFAKYNIKTNCGSRNELSCK